MTPLLHGTGHFHVHALDPTTLGYIALAVILGALAGMLVQSLISNR